MIPSGMLTIPEALKLICARIDDDDFLLQQNPKPSRDEAARESLANAILNEHVDIYIVRGGTLHHIRNELHLKTCTYSKDVAEALEGWEAWLASGRVRNRGKYNGCRLFVRPYELTLWLGPDPETISLATGGPGRPSSKHLVMQEVARRRAANETASSREAEAKCLAQWLADTHPNTLSMKASTIKNNLPADFQPHNARLTKL